MLCAVARAYVVAGGDWISASGIINSTCELWISDHKKSGDESIHICIEHKTKNC